MPARCGHEAAAEALCSIVVGGTHGLGVDGQNEARIGMTKTGLRRLEIHALVDEPGRIGSPQVVKTQPFQPRGAGGEQPDPMPKVRVLEWPAAGRGEHPSVSIGCCQPPLGEVVGSMAASSAGIPNVRRPASDFGGPSTIAPPGPRVRCQATARVERSKARLSQGQNDTSHVILDAYQHLFHNAGWDGRRATERSPRLGRTVIAPTLRAGAG
jgi:hypothetical protein